MADRENYKKITIRETRRGDFAGGSGGDAHSSVRVRVRDRRCGGSSVLECAGLSVFEFDGEKIRKAKAFAPHGPDSVAKAAQDGECLGVQESPVRPSAVCLLSQSTPPSTPHDSTQLEVT
jgi:hypothetical protein